MSEVHDNAARSRFELVEQGQIAFADYQRRGDVLIVSHVEAPMALRGTGAAGRLMEGMLGAIRQRRLKIVPSCAYADAYIRRHPQYEDLRA
jgi:predicted GNAT family acetyltransferase